MPLHPALGGSRPVYRRYTAASRIQAVVRRKKVQRNYNRYKLAKPVATLVQKKIDKNNPSRHTSYWLRRYQFTNLISDAPGQRLHTVIPTISQGVERHDREGTKIKLQSININGKIDIPADDNPAIGNGDRAQIYVRLMCLSLKQMKLLTDVINDWNADLNDKFFKNNSQPFGPTGQYLDMLSSINREVFTVHYDKVMKLSRNYPFFPDPTSTSGAASQVPTSKEFSINLKVKNKVLDYAQPSSNRSQNFQPFVCALFAYNNGSAPSTSAVPFIEYLSKVTFKE